MLPSYRAGSASLAGAGVYMSGQYAAAGIRPAWHNAALKENRSALTTTLSLSQRSDRRKVTSPKHLGIQAVPWRIAVGVMLTQRPDLLAPSFVRRRCWTCAATTAPRRRELDGGFATRRCQRIG